MSENLVPICNGKFGLCGYRLAPGAQGTHSSPAPQMVIPARFERAEPFSEGLAAVRIEGRWGFIDPEGRVVIQPTFEMVGRFWNGLAEFTVGDRAGVIDRNGDVVLEPCLTRAVPLTDRVVLAYEAPERRVWSYLDRGSPSDSARLPNSFGLFSIDGNWIKPQGLHGGMLFGPREKGLIWVRAALESGGIPSAYGLMNSSGEWVIPPRYKEVTVVAIDRAAVSLSENDEENGWRAGNVGLIDSTGTYIVEPGIYAYFGSAYKSDLIQVSKDRKRGYLTRNGQLVGEALFDAFKPFDGNTQLVRLGDEWKGLRLADGKIVDNPREGRLVFTDRPAGFKLIYSGEKYRIVDASGSLTSSHEIDAYFGDINADAPLGLKIGDKWTFALTDGRLMHDPPIYDGAGTFVEQFAVVKQGAASKIIDQTGREILEWPHGNLLALQHQSRMSDTVTRQPHRIYPGLFEAVRDGKRIIIDHLGNEQPEPEFKIAHLDSIPCRDGLFLKDREGLWGIADEDGSFIVQPEYRAIDRYVNGVAWAAVDSRKMWMPVGIDGRVRDGLPPPRQTHYPAWRSHSRHKQLHDDPYESSVLWTRWFLEAVAGRRMDEPEFVRDSFGR